MVSELVQVSKDYLRQETIGQAKKLGRLAALGLMAGAFGALAALFAGLGLLAVAKLLLPATSVGVVLARLAATLTAAGLAALVVWRGVR